MPNRSDRRPSMTPPHAKPNMVSVNGSDASARATPNSACTAGSTTGTDHMPTLPMVPSTTATLSRHQAKGDSAPPSKVPDLSISLVRATPRGASSSFSIGFLSSGLPCQLTAPRATAILHQRGGCPHGCRASRPWPPGGLVPAAARRVTFPGGAARAPQAQSDATSDRLDARGSPLMTQKTTSDRAFQLSLSGQRAPVDYERAPTYSSMIAEKDVLVPMRDGVKIAVDIYRPDTADKLPALLALSIHNKDLQGPEAAEASLSHPAWSMLWTGPAEAGDTRFFVARGYVHVIGNPRGIGKSEGGGSRAFDSYDLIEWIAAQPWCDGNVGMIGISGFGAEQFMAAKLKPPHLKAIFPFDPRGAYGEAGGFRDEYPGGVLHLFRFLLQVYA